MRIIPPIYTWNKGILKFNQSSSRLAHKPWLLGVILMVCVAVAMLLANLPATGHHYHAVLETNIQLHLFSDDGRVNVLFPKDMTVEKFINDILMVLFFFVVGLEIKREFAKGALSSTRKAMLPVIAAFGGVLAPALIYTAVNAGTASAGGWGIPTATDIAFAVCIISMMGGKVPLSLKIFLTALAVTDDLIAILVVILFYGGGVNPALLGLSLAVIAFVFLMRRLGEKRMFPYIACTLLVWVLFYYSGIHATMSGVVMAFLIPSAPLYNKAQYYHKRNRLIARLDELAESSGEPFPNHAQRSCLRRLESVAHGTLDMSYRIEHALGPWVNFLIVPLFALANAGVTIGDTSLLNIFRYDSTLGSVSMGVFFGLLVGKPLGIMLFSWLAVKFRIAAMPENGSWRMLAAVACLGGIGFTMSIFIDTLSFGEQPEAVMLALRDAGKIAVLLASICSGIFGSLMIMLTSRREKARRIPQESD